MVLRYFTRGDIVLIAGLLIVSAASVVGIRQHGFNSRHAVVEVEGKRVLELSLDRDVTTTVTVPLGETVIVVEDGMVRIENSPCPLHYCIRMGRIRYKGEIIACLPNRVLITIKGGNKKDTFDGVTQ
jgi:hypothetical protein